MKKFRLLSGILAFLMLFSAFAVLPVYAEDEVSTDEVTDDAETETGTESGTGSDSSLTPGIVPTVNYLTKKFESAEDKLASMEEMVSSADGRYTLYADPVSGEVAYHDNLVGQTLFTNPYNMATESASSSNDVKSKIMSQVIVKYLNAGTEAYYYSYEEAAERGQIDVKHIKNGIRVEYSIGPEESRKLVPRMIEKSRFESQITDLIFASEYGDWLRAKWEGYYTLKDINEPGLSPYMIAEMINAFPACADMAIYVLSADVSSAELNEIEKYIMLYCPKYTYDELNYDHEKTDYQGNDQAPALFKMALEYYLEDGTLRVRFPVNGLRFDDVTYQLTSIQILPYFGCGTYLNDGYLFLPDGSGTIIRFEDFSQLPGKTITGKLYGQDYAFYQLTGQHQEVIRLPMYGVVENDIDVASEYIRIEKEPYYNESGKLVSDDYYFEIEDTYTSEDKGYFAIIEEGESLATISTETGGLTNKFDTIYTTLTPRQRDTYDISEAVSGANSTMLTVTSKRKYTDNFTLRVVMLNDDAKAKEAGLSVGEYYSTDYVGMVNFARDYYESNGVLTRFTDDEVKEDIPLYIESFGTVTTQDTFLSFPISVQTPLTTFEDLKTMTAQLNEKGITNLNYKLTGYFNGGLTSTIPYKLEVEENTGGKKGFKDFMSYAGENNIGVYPDFDFVWADAGVNSIFSGLNKRSHIIRTMNTKYANLREYNPLYQAYNRSMMLAISPAFYSYFYDEFTDNYSKLNPIGISVASLGNYLSSDFDQEDPYNREDNKLFTEELLARIQSEYGKVMVEGGNAYTLPYVTDILNMPLDSSGYLNASDTVPFMGMLLHGYVNFAGMPLNVAGDIQYQILRAIENGAAMFFQLSYQNTLDLKNTVAYSDYYSIDFNIWLDDVVEAYTTLNEATKDLQSQLIVDHRFLQANRALSEEELAAVEADNARVYAELEAKWAADEAERIWAAEQAAIDLKITEETGGLIEPTTPDQRKKAEADELKAIEAGIAADIKNFKNRNVLNNGKAVYVEYEDGTAFYLNYNNYDIIVYDIPEEDLLDENGCSLGIGEIDLSTYTSYTIPAMGFVRVD